MMARIKGRVGIAEDGPHKGKWYFSLWVTGIDGRTEGIEQITIGPWKDESEAKQQLERAARLGCEEIERRATGKVSGEYIDMREAVLRKWGDDN